MKTSSGLTIIGSTLLLATAGHAQSADKLYLGLNLGVAIPQSTEIRVSPLGNDGKMDYDPGIRGGINLGYNFTSSFAGELETGVIWNSIHSFNMSTGNNVLSTEGASADIYQIPILANFIYEPLHGDFAPYIGVGAGGETSVFDSSNIPLFGARFSAADFAFAYQVEAGFKYFINPKVELGLGYKFLGTTDHNWSDNGITFKTDGTMTHAVMATFDWRF